MPVLWVDKRRFTLGRSSFDPRKAWCVATGRRSSPICKANIQEGSRLEYLLARRECGLLIEVSTPKTIARDIVSQDAWLDTGGRPDVIGIRVLLLIRELSFYKFPF